MDQESTGKLNQSLCVSLSPFPSLLSSPCLLSLPLSSFSPRGPSPSQLPTNHTVILCHSLLGYTQISFS